MREWGVWTGRLRRPVHTPSFHFPLLSPRRGESRGQGDERGYSHVRRTR